MSDKDKENSAITNAENLEINLKEQMQKLAVNRQDDYEYGREILYSSSENIQDLIDIAIELAKESSHPRAIEVATNAIAAYSEIAAKLLEHQLRVEKLNNPKGESKNVTNNNVNVKLNTKDLLELLNKE